MTTATRPIYALGELVRKSVIQVPHDADDAVYVGFLSFVLAPDNEVTQEQLAEAIRDAEDGEFQKVSIDRLREGPSYIELGAWIGDQGLAMAFMGLGALLGLWDIVTPKTMGITDEDQANGLMGRGFIMIAPKSGTPLTA